MASKRKDGVDDGSSDAKRKKVADDASSSDGKKKKGKANELGIILKKSEEKGEIQQTRWKRNRIEQVSR